MNAQFKHNLSTNKINVISAFKKNKKPQMQNT